MECNYPKPSGIIVFCDLILRLQFEFAFLQSHHSQFLINLYSYFFQMYYLRDPSILTVYLGIWFLFSKWSILYLLFFTPFLNLKSILTLISVLLGLNYSTQFCVICKFYKYTCSLRLRRKNLQNLQNSQLNLMVLQDEHPFHLRKSSWWGLRHFWTR